LYRSSYYRIACGIFVFSAWMAAVSAPPASAVAQAEEPFKIEGVSFSRTYAEGSLSLRLNNAALLRYKILFRGYVVGLYLPEGTDPAAALSEVPKRLEFSYFWEIPGPEFGKAGEKILVRNVDGRTMAALRDRLDRINDAYRDVKPGDRYALTYRPGKGTELSLNGEPLLTVEGADFAAAYFSIWLGEKPIDDGLKKELLRKGSEQARQENM